MNDEQMMQRRRFLGQVSAAGAAALVAGWLPGRTRGAMGGVRPWLETVTAERFRALQGTSFLLDIGPGAQVPLRLQEVVVESAYDPAPMACRQPFSVFFLPVTNTSIPQDTYRLHHGKLGSFDLFLVPDGPPGHVRRLQAVFT